MSSFVISRFEVGTSQGINSFCPSMRIAKLKAQKLAKYNEDVYIFDKLAKLGNPQKWEVDYNGNIRIVQYRKIG